MKLEYFHLFAVQLYQDLACCAAVKANGANVEHALHLLYLAKGNIQVQFFSMYKFTFMSWNTMLKVPVSPNCIINDALGLYTALKTTSYIGNKEVFIDIHVVSI